MQQFPETELILNSENRVYHLNLKNEDIADDVILVGDQNRVAEISILSVPMPVLNTVKRLP